MLLRPDFPRPLAGGATLRRHLATAATYGARPRDGEPTLTERDRPAAPALGTGRERRTGRAARPAARRALLRQRQHDRNLSPERRHAEGNRDHRLDLFLFLRRCTRAAATEDRREQVPEPAERAQIRHVEVRVPPPRTGSGCSTAEAAAPACGAGKRPVAP